MIRSRLSYPLKTLSITIETRLMHNFSLIMSIPLVIFVIVIFLSNRISNISFSCRWTRPLGWILSDTYEEAPAFKTRKRFCNCHLFQSAQSLCRHEKVHGVSGVLVSLSGCMRWGYEKILWGVEENFVHMSN